MKIIIDAHGGDNAPLEILKGTAMAIKEYGVEAILCGNETQLRTIMAQEKIFDTGMTFREAAAEMPVEADPAEVMKGYYESSLAVGLKLLADGEGQAYVSAGSTGALVVGASLIVKRIKGIKRAAIGVMVPFPDGAYMLMDAGANAECRPEMLVQFGIMGSIYMEKIAGVRNPRVAVVNIGAEDNKGLELQIEAGKLLRHAPLNFTGNVEARELPLGGCDVAVTDGFTGNIVLKLTEGMGKMMGAEIKRILMHSAATKIAAVALKSGLDAFKARMDYTEYGGAPLLGVQKPVIKAHGSSNAKAIKNAIRQAVTVAEKDVPGGIAGSLEELIKRAQEAAEAAAQEAAEAEEAVEEAAEEVVESETDETADASAGEEKDS